MVALTNAYTAPVNPSGISPILSRTTVFAGLRRKVRHAPEFVPVIESCKVISEEGNVVTREVVFKGDPTVIREVCTEFEPTKVDFKQPDGSTISNIISEGPNGKPEDLSLSYSFEWIYPDIEEGDPKIEELKEKNKQMAKMAVDKTLSTIRMLVEKGELKLE